MKLQEANLNLTEQEYRDLDCLSYSMISRYDREGYDYLDTIDEQLVTPAITFGSLVDCLMTQGQEIFDAKYVAFNIPLPGESVMAVMQNLFSKPGIAAQLGAVTDEDILDAANACEYQKNWKDATRIAKLREAGSAYFNFCMANKDKTIVSVEDVNDAKKIEEALKSDVYSSDYFVDDNFRNRERIYQLQLKAFDEVSGLNFKGMLDLVIIDHDHKQIIPCDLKTTKSVYGFEDSFYKYRYYLQASMYTELLKITIEEKCQELKDYTITPYRFIVIDRVHLKPVVFEWEPSDDVIDKNGMRRKDWRQLLDTLDFAIKFRDSKLPLEWFADLDEFGVVKLINGEAKPAEKI